MEGGSGVGPSSMAKSSKDDDEIVVAGVDQLPPGFRFHPTDEEIIMNYLLMKVMDKGFTAIAVAEADFNKCEPWDLPKRAKNTGEKEWFFFCQRDRKYPRGMRTNRATETGYWKATGKDREIYMKKGSRNCLVGIKKTLVFYKGRAPKGDKSNWVMHEYRLEGNFSTYNFTRAAKDSWVVCKVFHKNTGSRTIPSGELARMNSFMDHLLDNPTLPPLADYSYPSARHCSNFAKDEPEFKANLSFNNYNLLIQHDQKTPPHDNYTHNTSYQLHPRNTDPNPIFIPQNAPDDPSGFFPYQGFAGIGPTSSYGTNFSFKGVDQVNSNVQERMTENIVREQERMCKTENFSSNSMVSRSRETAVGSAEMANEITSVNLRREDTDESKNPFDQELEGLAFSPNMSDLDSLWSY